MHGVHLKYSLTSGVQNASFSFEALELASPVNEYWECWFMLGHVFRKTEFKIYSTVKLNQRLKCRSALKCCFGDIHMRENFLWTILRSHSISDITDGVLKDSSLSLPLAFPVTTTIPPWLPASKGKTQSVIIIAVKWVNE